MPQQFTLYPDLTARENVDFVGSLFGMLWRRRRERDPRGTRARSSCGTPATGGQRDVRRDAAPSRARRRPRPRADAALPRRADRGHRPDPARHGLGRDPPAPRRRPDAPRDHPVRRRRRGLRPGRAHRRRPADRVRPRRTTCVREALGGEVIEVETAGALRRDGARQRARRRSRRPARVRASSP